MDELGGHGPLDGTTWVVERGPVLPSGGEVTLTFTGAALSGSTGCNQLRGGYEVDGEALRLTGPLAVTRRAGPPALMALEHDVLDRLPRVARYRLDGDDLDLLDDAGQLLFGLRAVDAEGLRGRWLVLAVHHPERQAVVSAEGEPVLVIEDEVLHGTTGCNQLRGGWSADSRTIAIGPLMVTRQQCDDRLMEQEQALLGALESAAGYRLTPTQLHLLRADGGIAVTMRRLDG